MKTFLTRLKSSLALLFALLAIPGWAAEKPVAQVTEISGQVFLITPEGKTKSLKMKDHVAEKSEIMVDEGGSVTLNDYYDATYHLNGGTHLKFFNKSVQLKKGNTWIQSLNPRHGLALTTANGHVDFWKGEFITTFDQATSRSQILVVAGDVEVSNILDRNMKYSVPAGTFTLVDPELENGVPRAPTKVGLASLNVAMEKFKKLPEVMREAPLPARGIASVEEAAPAGPEKKGEIIFISSTRMPASVNGGAHKYFKKLTKKKPELTDAPISFIGTSWTPRSPASTPISRPLSGPATLSLQPDADFDQSLKIQAKEQPYHSKELEGLINDLKSY